MNYIILRYDILIVLSVYLYIYFPLKIRGLCDGWEKITTKNQNEQTNTLLELPSEYECICNKRFYAKIRLIRYEFKTL